MKFIPEFPDKYIQLEKMIYEENALTHFSLHQIAEMVGLKYTCALNYWSHMIKFHTKNTGEKRTLILKCPSCGKLKHEVTSQTECRDVFHYL